MADRLVVILASGDPRVVEAGLMYARNAVKHRWMREVKLFLFGPAESAVASEPTLRKAIEAVLDEGMTPMACKACSDKDSVSDALADLGCDVAYVGEPISEAIRDGYIPMVW